MAMAAVGLERLYTVGRVTGVGEGSRTTSVSCRYRPVPFYMAVEMNILQQVIQRAPYLTEEQKIAYCVYAAVLDVQRQEEKKLEAFAQRLRDAVDL